MARPRTRCVARVRAAVSIIWPSLLTGVLSQQTQLPPDYIDLEKRVDALKQVHQKMLAVT